MTGSPHGGEGHAQQNKRIRVKLPQVFRYFSVKLVKINVITSQGTISPWQCEGEREVVGRVQGQSASSRSAQRPNGFQKLRFEEGGALSTRSGDVSLHRCIPGKCEQGGRDL